MATFITLGAKANCFHDASTGITVCKGEKIELRDSQLKSKRIRAALSSGHLVYATSEPVQVVTPEETKRIDKKVKAQYKNGVAISKIAEDLSFEQAKSIAEFNSVTIDGNDDQESILKAILEDSED